ncbi:MAG TPA: hypothetical protein VF828_03215 [Patescibacteria group bacterium]
MISEPGIKMTSISKAELGMTRFDWIKELGEVPTKEQATFFYLTKHEFPVMIRGKNVIKVFEKLKDKPLLVPTLEEGENLIVGAPVALKEVYFENPKGGGYLGVPCGRISLIECDEYPSLILSDEINARAALPLKTGRKMIDFVDNLLAMGDEWQSAKEMGYPEVAETLEKGMYGELMKMKVARQAISYLRDGIHAKYVVPLLRGNRGFEVKLAKRK